MEFPPISLNEEYLMTRIGRLTVNLGAATEQISARDTYIESMNQEIKRLSEANATLEETIETLLAEDSDDAKDD